MPSPKALHSKKTPKWGTPEHIIEAARKLLGYIHLDPASSEEFNAYVRALMIYTERDNGLAPECEWHGNIFLNPPGGLVVEFWEKLMAAIKTGTVPKAFWVGFSVEQLCLLADQEMHPMDFSICLLRKRLSFNEQVDTPILGPWNQQMDDKAILIEARDPVSGNKVQQLRTIIGYEPPKIVQGNSPSHGNYVCAIGCDKKLFEEIFLPLGKVSHGKLAEKT